MGAASERDRVAKGWSLPAVAGPSAGAPKPEGASLRGGESKPEGASLRARASLRGEVLDCGGRTPRGVATPLWIRGRIAPGDRGAGDGSGAGSGSAGSQSGAAAALCHRSPKLGHLEIALARGRRADNVMLSLISPAEAQGRRVFVWGCGIPRPEPRVPASLREDSFVSRL
jgi:hypothetical protein